jgi:transketolase
MSMNDVERWRELGQQLRVDAVRASAKAGSGHPSSSMSAADLAAVLLAAHFRYDFDDPRSPANDRIVFSKGHASPLVYGLFRAAGALSEEEFGTYRQFGSRLQGHPTPALPWVDVATGSLGQGLPIGVGLALAGKRLDRLPFRVWVICGDSEMAEGSMWEAIEHAAFYELDNLTAIIDVNRLGQRGETMHGWDLASYSDRLRAFGWHAIEIDGHDVEAIDAAYREAESTTGKPTAIVAKTIKGKGYSKIEDQGGWHGKAVAAEAVEELGGVRNVVVDVPKPDHGDPHRFEPAPAEWPRYEPGDKVATRKAYGEGLAALGGSDPRVVALDGEVSNSTYAEIFAKAHPERFFEMYIAEQQMVGAAVGMQVLGWKPFASTFAAFMSRAYDFIRMAAISRATLKLSGSHAGVSIGEDGPSQMALEDLASLRAITGSTVLYPCDGNQTAQLVRAMADLDGISFLRTTRADTEVIYGPDEDFPVGGATVVRSSDEDDVALIGAGITLHEALEAAETLAADGIAARVIDLYSVKPIDAETLRAAAEATGGRLVVAEDHRAEGGLGEAVMAVFAEAEEHPRIVHLAVRELPLSGKPAELLAAAGIDAEHIAEAARKLVRAGAVGARGR